MSKRVAETTTDSTSASPGEAAGVASCARQTTGARTSIATGKNQTERFCITNFLQLRESDLLGPELPRGVSSPSSHSSFCEEVFSALRRPDTAGQLHRMRWTGQIFWLLAYDACKASHLVPAFTPEIVSGIGPMGSRIQLQQRNCSRFSRDFLRRSTFPSSQRTETRTSGLRFQRQDY